jgi:hypothetical protein
MEEPMDEAATRHLAVDVQICEKKTSSTRLRIHTSVIVFYMHFFVFLSPKMSEKNRIFAF